MRNFYRRWWCGNEEVVGIDFRDEMVLMVCSTTLGGAVEHPRTFAIPLPPGVIERGVIKEPDELASLVKGSFDVSKVRAGRCGVAIPSHALFTAYLDMPEEVRGAHLSEVYAWALSRLSLDASTTCGQVYLCNRDPRELPQLFFAATRRSVKESLEATCQALDLELSCITLRSIALHNGARVVVPRQATQVTVWIDLTERSPCVYLFDGDEVRFSRRFEGASSTEMGPLIVEVYDQLQRGAGMRYVHTDVAAVCAGPRELVEGFRGAWRDRFEAACNHPFARLDIAEIRTDEGGQHQYLIAHGLALLARGFT
jgi:Tfp pilus assembly PilM family ATPase